MNDELNIPELSVHLALLSLMAVGGGLVMIAPEIRTYIVDDKALLLNEQFAAAYVLAQAAPGPNLLFVSLIGYFAGGWLAAIAATVSVTLPCAMLTLALIKIRVRQIEGKVSQAARRAFAPISVGLLGATAWIFAGVSNAGWHGHMVTALSAIVLLKTRLNPVLLIGMGAAAGMKGFI